MREVDLARHVRAYLETEGYETFSEVQGQDSQAVADIVGIRGPNESVIVECKARRDPIVIEQARRWQGQATMIYAAIPNTHSRDPERWLGRLHEYGIGQLAVDPDGEVCQPVSPVRRRVDGLGIRASLKEEHRDYAEAGNAEGKRWGTTAALRDKFLANVTAGMPLKSMDWFSENEQHQLRRLLRQGSIKGWEVRHGGKCYPVGFCRWSVKGGEE